MSRAVLILTDPASRNKACDWIRRAPAGTRVEFKRAKRTIPQNDYMWMLLGDIAQQADHFGRKYKADKWKLIFMDALGREMELAPSLDGRHIVSLGQSSSDLSKQEMTDLIDLLLSWGAEHGVVFQDAQVAA